MKTKDRQYDEQLVVLLRSFCRGESGAQEAVADRLEETGDQRSAEARDAEWIWSKLINAGRLPEFQEAASREKDAPYLEIAAGKKVHPDGWAFASVLQSSFSDDAEFLGNKFRLPSGRYPDDCPYPVSIEVTGKKVNYRRGHSPRVRVRVTWIHDGEEPTYSHGWMFE